MYFICVYLCVCVGCQVCGPGCVCVCLSFLPESWSCFPGRPQGVPQGSSCRPSGTSPEHESSPTNGSPGHPPPPAYDARICTNAHTHIHKHIVTDASSSSGLISTNPPPAKRNVQTTSKTHRLLPVSVVSGGGRALLSPGPPSWAGDGGSTR